ncbi:MAG: C40 family peptidase [Ignavibacteria bacterium]|nr:C40 family peptidase [Ignavibacteria bacterium]
MSKLKLFIYFIFILSVSGIHSQENPSLYAVAVKYTPVLNTPDFEDVFGGAERDKVKLDEQGLIREMEFIAFPNTVFEITERIPKEGYSIYKIITSDYPYESSPLYIDSRFVEVRSDRPDERNKVMPERNDIIENILSLEGRNYMWGGNYGDGVEELLNYYRPASEIDVKEKTNWILKGVDCSGLIYQATGGATPRNTSSLIKYGEGLIIEGKSLQEISEMLKPLDLIVWSGHVIVTLDKNTVIESSPEDGVHRSDLIERLNEVMTERSAVNDWASTTGKRFVIRRWIE